MFPKDCLKVNFHNSFLEIITKVKIFYRTFQELAINYSGYDNRILFYKTNEK